MFICLLLIFPTNELLKGRKGICLLHRYFPGLAQSRGLIITECMSECGDLGLCAFSKKKTCRIEMKTPGPAGQQAGESRALSQTRRMPCTAVLWNIPPSLPHLPMAPAEGLVSACSCFKTQYLPESLNTVSTPPLHSLELGLI